ncbi:MAG: SAM-dependent methyltransferase [Clostridia bacterium]|nr:SAM-dependent methyltransferase [Clostridia bacterium]
MLSERLQKIADCVNAKTLADIGTDHAYIPIHCVKDGSCLRAIACDINAGPLKAASENIGANGLASKIQTRLSNGLEALSPNEADTIVIAGMGGFLIRDILINGADKIGDNTVLILQPMVAAAELREYLCKNGYDIFKEHLAREESKFYNILCVKKGECEYSAKDILVGKIDADDENYADYIAFHKNVIEKIIAGLEKSSGKEVEIAMYKEKLDLIMN